MEGHQYYQHPKPMDGKTEVVLDRESRLIGKHKLLVVRETYEGAPVPHATAVWGWIEHWNPTEDPKQQKTTVVPVHLDNQTALEERLRKELKIPTNEPFFFPRSNSYSSRHNPWL
jgi:hypothetical protein